MSTFPGHLISRPRTRRESRQEGIGRMIGNDENDAAEIVGARPRHGPWPRGKQKVIGSDNLAIFLLTCLHFGVAGARELDWIQET